MRGSTVLSILRRACAAVAVAFVAASGTLTGHPSDPAGAQTNATVVYKDPAAANLFLGAGPLIIAERVQGVPTGLGLGAFQLRITYNPQYVALTLSLGSFAGSTGRDVICVTKGTLGDVTYACISTGVPPGPSGSGTLAIISVQPAPGLQLRAVPLNYAEANLHDVASSTVLADPLGTPYFITAVSDSRLYVRALEGDVTVDCAVDNADLTAISNRYGATKGSLLYSPMFDLQPTTTPDGDIDILDVMAVSSRMGSTCASPVPAQPPPPPPCIDSDSDSVCDKADVDDDNDGMPDKFEAAYACINPLVADATGDADSDGLTNLNEANLNTNPCSSDTDGDGAGDGYEASRPCRDPRVADANADPDADSLTNIEEVAASTEPCIADSDSDGLSDGYEVNTAGTNPLDADSDDDGLADGVEVNSLQTNPLDADSDDDGLSDGDEVNATGTSPLNADSDNDGLSDGAEVNSLLTDPLDADSDDDGLSDGYEVNTAGTNPLDADSDDDGLADGVEVNSLQTNPLDADSDDDGLSDGDEVNTTGTSPLDADSDDDGLSDGNEVNALQTDPLDADSDDDGLSDGSEVLTYQTNPLLADSEGDGMPDAYEVARLSCGLSPMLNDAELDADTDSLANLAERMMGTEPCNRDTDSDGCADGKEVQTASGSQVVGGRRNPLNQWDYFNPSHDGKNRVDDILAVLNDYFVDQGEAGYTSTTDRTIIGPNSWNLGPPDGKQRIDDVINVLRQYFHDCSV